MSIIQLSRRINAPVEKVYDVISDIENYSAAVPHITHVEFLSESRVGVGTRFRETRLVKGREAKSTLEVTEYVKNERIQIISDEGGSKWVSDFTITPENEACILQLSLHANAYKLMAKIINPLIKGVVTKAIADDLDAVKNYCEKNCLAHISQ